MDEDKLPIFEPKFQRTTTNDPVPKIKSFKSHIHRNINSATASKKRNKSNKGGSPKRGRSAASILNVSSSARRVVVQISVINTKTTYGIKSAAMNLRYIERDSAGLDGKEGELFNDNTTNKYPENWIEKNIEWSDKTENEPHQFRMMVSPEEGHDLDLTDYTRELMTRIEKDLGRNLVWTAANHYNTDNPHTHIIISGLDKEGKELWIDKEYISNGIRNRARELATQELGQRTEQEIEASLNKEITQERYTSIDKNIKHISYENTVDLKEYPIDISNRKSHARMIGRLKYLESIGLAKNNRTGLFTLNDNWQNKLKELGERTDIIKTMNKGLKESSLQYRIYDKENQTTNLTGRLVKSGLHDENTNRYYVVVEGKDGTANYVKVGKNIDVSKFRYGSIVSIQNYQDSWVKKSDHVVDNIAYHNQGIYNSQSHIKHLKNNPETIPHKIQPDDYVEAINRRLNRLAKHNLTQEIKPGIWKIEKDFIKELELKDRESPHSRNIRIKVIDERSLNAQIKSEGRAWIDQVDSKNNAPYSFGSEVNDAIRKRQQFLEQELLLDKNDTNLLKRLDSIERQKLEDKFSETSLRRKKPLAQGEYKGKLNKVITAPSGNRYALITSESPHSVDKEFTMIPWRNNMEKSLGKEVSYGLTKQNIPFVKAISRGLQR